MSLLGFSVDPKLEGARQKDERGYVDQDMELLKALKILVKEGSIWVLNKSLGIRPEDIRTLMKWISSGKTPPLPDIVRKILCLKRDSLVRSSASTPVSNGLRASHRSIIAEIDKILRDGGARPCLVNTPRTPSSVAGFRPSGGTPGSGTPGGGTPGSGMPGDAGSCCADIEKSIAEIQKSLSELKARPGVDHSSAFKELNGRIDLVLKTITEGLAEQGRVFNEKLDSLIAHGQTETNVGLGELPTIEEGSEYDAEQDILKILRSLYIITAQLSDKPTPEGLPSMHAKVSNILAQSQQIIRTLENIPILNGRIEALENAVAALTARLAAAAPAADAFAGIVAPLNNLRDALQPLVPAIQEIRAAQQADKADLDRQIAGLREQVAAIPGLAASVEQLRVAQVGNHAAIQAAIAQLQARIDAIPPPPAAPHPAAGPRHADPAAAPDPRIAAIQASIDQIIATLGTVPKNPDLAPLGATLAQINQRLDELNEQLEDVPNQAAIEAAINARFNEMRPMLDRIEPLAAELDGARANIRNIRAAIGEGPGNSVRTTLAAQTAELAALRGQITELSQFVRSPERAAQEERVRANLTETKNGVAAIQRQLAQITAPGSAIFQPVIDAIQVAREAIIERIDALEAAAAPAAAAAPPAENPELAALRRQLDDLTRIREGLEDRIRLSTADVERLTRELEQCRQEQRAAQTASRAVDERTRAENERLEQRIRDLETEIARRRDAEARCMETVKTLTEEKLALIAHIAELMGQITELRGRLEAAGVRITELERIQANLERAVAELQGQRERNAAEQRAATEAAAAATAAALAEAQRAAEEASAELERLRAAAAASGASAEETRSRLLEAQARVDATREYERIVEDLRDAQRRLAECEQSHAALTAQMARNREAANAAHREELARVQREAEAALRARNVEYRNALRQAEADFTEAREALNAGYRQEAEAARRECGAIRDRTVAEKDAEIARIRAELEGRLADCERRHTEADAARTTAQARVTELEASRARANTDASQLRTQLTEAQAAQTAQRARIEALERDCAGAAAVPTTAVPTAGDIVPATETMDVSPEVVERTSCIPNTSIEAAVDVKFPRATPEEKTQIKNRLKDLDRFACGTAPMAGTAVKLHLATLLRNSFFRPASNIRYGGTQYVYNQRTVTDEQLRYFAKAVLQLVEPAERRELSIGPTVVPRANGRGCVGPSCLGSRRKRRDDAGNNSGRRTRKAARK